MPSDLLTGANRETDCQRQTEPWGGCNEYAAPYGGDDLINNHKLSLWPSLLGAALCARANGPEFTGPPKLTEETAITSYWAAGVYCTLILIIIQSQ